MAKENTPVTEEYALDRLMDALHKGDYKEVKKWELIIREINETRIRWKQRMRKIKEAYLKNREKEMYRRPIN